jgi:aromatic-L-amino-acid decarboxylase
VDLARDFTNWIEESDRFELAAPVPLNLICFRLKGGDVANQQLIKTLNASGKLFLTHTILDGKFTLRFCIGQTNTRAEHVKSAWQMVQNAAEEL